MGLAHTVWCGVQQPGHALAFKALIVVGEPARWGSLPGQREPPPLGTAGALAYAPLGGSGGEPSTHGVLQWSPSSSRAQLVACVPHVARGSGPAVPEAEQRRIALLGGAVVRRTGAAPADRSGAGGPEWHRPSPSPSPSERQAGPHHEQPLSARIVRTANAYDGLCGEGVGGSSAALERLRLGTGRDHQPEVVESLARVLARGGLTPVPPG